MNVYEDLGFKNPDVCLVKADFCSAINACMTERGLTQVEAGKLLGIGQSKVSLIVRGHGMAFSFDSLIRYLKILGCTVSTKVSKPAKVAGTVVCTHVPVAATAPKPAARSRRVVTAPRSVAASGRSAAGGRR